jgi:hypothetical protein
LANALVVVVGVLTIAVSLVLGVVAMAILGSIVLVLASIIGIRVCWFKRIIAMQSGKRSQKPGSPGPEIIEGEGRVISTDQSRNSQRRE